MRTQGIPPRSLLAGLFLATAMTTPAQAAPEDAKRELERLKLSSDSLSATPVSIPGPSDGTRPGEAATITVMTPIAVIGLGSAFGYVGTAFGVLAAPFTMGAGHFHAGDPQRGTMVGLTAPLVMLTSFLAFGTLGDRIEDPSVRYFRGWTTGLLGSLIMTTGYWAWAAQDATETARRKQDEANRQAPAAPR